MPDEELITRGRGWGSGSNRDKLELWLDLTRGGKILHFCDSCRSMCACVTLSSGYEISKNITAFLNKHHRSVIKKEKEKNLGGRCILMHLVRFTNKKN